MNTKREISRQNKEIIDSLKILKDLVSINSQSKNISGVNEAQHYLGDELSKSGLNVKYFENSEVLSGELLVAELGEVGKPLINLIGHVDTVLVPDLNNPFRIEQSTARVYGSGIADDKAGLVIAFNAIEDLLKKGGDFPYRVRLISSPSEELGSIGWQKMFKFFGDEAVANLGLEPSLANGNIITSRNGNRWYNIGVKGKSSHAGRFGISSINASHELSRIIYELHKLNDYPQKIKLNVGSFSGGTGHFNVTCGEATAKLDVRFPCFQSRDQLHENVLFILNDLKCPCFETGDFSKVVWNLEDDCPPLPLSPCNIPYIESYTQYISHIEDKEIQGTHSGGAADINYFTNPSNINVDGLGAIGAGLHTKQEFIEIPSLVSRRLGLTHLMKQIFLNQSILIEKTHEEFLITGDI